MKYILIFIFICSSWSVIAQKNKITPKVVRKAKVSRTSVAIKSAPMKRRTPASDPDAPIEVRGQSRNLNMLLILQNQDEIIDFIKMRKDYQDETQRMNY